MWILFYFMKNCKIHDELNLNVLEFFKNSI